VPSVTRMFFSVESPGRITVTVYADVADPLRTVTTIVFTPSCSEQFAGEVAGVHDDGDPVIV